MPLKIKNWKRHQHFKDRRPPWVKLHKEILDDPDWHDLDGDSAKLLISLWLIASEDPDLEGALPDSKRLAFRVRITEKQLNQTLIKLSDWLIHDDIDVISGRYQVDAPETKTETETETPDKPVSFNPKTYLLSESVSESVITDWLALRKLKRSAVTLTAIAGIKREAEKAGYTLENALIACCERGWQGFKAVWVANDPKPEAESTFDHVAYEAKRKADAAAARDRMRAEA